MIQSLVMLGRGLGRISFVVALGFLPIGALAWMGCGDATSKKIEGLGKADPGGTWGAQVAVTVVGRGRVKTSANTIDCPSSACFHTDVFPNNQADGASGGITLTAEPTAGSKFLGWSFEAVNLGASGRGPDTCNPVQRPTTLPTVNAADLNITLPYGQVDGTSPVGQEGACGAFKTVPLAYKVTATFEGDLPDAGPDANDGGAGEVVTDVASNGAFSATALGIASGYLFMHVAEAAGDAVYYLSTPESTFVPQTASKSGSLTSSITRFKVESSGVVLADSNNDLWAVRSSSPSTLMKVGSTNSIGTCNQVAMDFSNNVYCRTSTAIAIWKFSSSTSSWGSPTTPFVDLSFGSEIAVDSSNIYYAASSEIRSVPLNGTDASVPQTIVSSVFNPSFLIQSSTRLAWSDSGSINVSSGKFSSSSVTPTGLGAIVGIPLALAVDPNSSSTLYALGNLGIGRVSSGGTPETIKSENGGLAGMAVGYTYVFYSSGSLVYRLRKPSF